MLTHVMFCLMSYVTPILCVWMNEEKNPLVMLGLHDLLSSAFGINWIVWYEFYKNLWPTIKFNLITINLCSPQLLLYSAVVAYRLRKSQYFIYLGHRPSTLHDYLKFNLCLSSCFIKKFHEPKVQCRKKLSEKFHKPQNPIGSDVELVIIKKKYVLNNVKITKSLAENIQFESVLEFNIPIWGAERV